MRILITGASGYIGSQLIKKAIANNHLTILASRYQCKVVRQWLPFDINDLSNLAFPEKIDAVVHLAANTSPGKTEKQHEMAAAKTLITAANKVCAKFVFVSSQTAREDAPTNYGRLKWRIEQEVLAANGLVVRLGQVYGGAERGLFGTLVRLIQCLPVLPAFMPSPLIQPIHVDDCAKGLLNLVELKETRSGVYCLASPEPISFTKFLRAIAQQRVRKHKFFLPFPTSLVKLLAIIIGVRLAEKLGLYRLTSLFDLPVMETTQDLKAVGLCLRPLSSGMHRSGSDRRRKLIKEGIALLTYLLRETPSSELIRRYVRMIEELRMGAPVDIPTWLFFWPASLALLDDRKLASSQALKEFCWRVDAATVIAEASLQGAFRFLGSTRSIWQVTALTKIVAAVGSEFVWRLLRFFLPLSFLCLFKKRGS